MLSDIFCFAKHPEKATYHFGYRITLTKKINTAVLQKGPQLAHAKNIINNIRWYSRYYTPSMPQQVIISKQILSKASTELRYPERSVLLRDVTEPNLWTFQLRS